MHPQQWNPTHPGRSRDLKALPPHWVNECVEVCMKTCNGGKMAAVFVSLCVNENKNVYNIMFNKTIHCNPVQVLQVQWYALFKNKDYLIRTENNQYWNITKHPAHSFLTHIANIETITWHALYITTYMPITVNMY